MLTAGRQAGKQAARQPGSQAARQPGSQAARQPGSQAARQPGSQAASQAARQPGAVERLRRVFGGVLPETPRAAKSPASTNQTDIRHEIRCLAVQHLGRVPRLRMSV